MHQYIHDICQWVEFKCNISWWPFNTKIGNLNAPSLISAACIAYSFPQLWWPWSPFPGQQALFSWLSVGVFLPSRVPAGMVLLLRFYFQGLGLTWLWLGWELCESCLHQRMQFIYHRSPWLSEAYAPRDWSPSTAGFRAGFADWFDNITVFFSPAFRWFKTGLIVTYSRDGSRAMGQCLDFTSGVTYFGQKPRCGWFIDYAKHNLLSKRENCVFTACSVP